MADGVSEDHLWEPGITGTQLRSKAWKLVPLPSESHLYKAPKS